MGNSYCTWNYSEDSSANVFDYSWNLWAPSCGTDSRDSVAALAIASAILYLVLFAGVFVDTLLDVTRENIVDFILS